MRFFKPLCVAAILVLGACSSAPQATALPGLTFAHLQPLALNVSVVDIRDDSKPLKAQDESFVIAPGEALETYIQRRFAAAGPANKLEAIIEEADVTHAYKPSPNSAGKFFEVAGIDEYDVKVRLRLEHDDGAPQPLYSNTLTVHRMIRVSEHASVAEREKRQMEGLEILFQDLDREAQRIVLQDMRLGL